MHIIRNQKDLNLTLHLNGLEKEIKPTISRSAEIIKSRVEINRDQKNNRKDQQN